MCSGPWVWGYQTGIVTAYRRVGVSAQSSVGASVGACGEGVWRFAFRGKRTEGRKERIWISFRIAVLKFKSSSRSSVRFLLLLQNFSRDFGRLLTALQGVPHDSAN
jgi:hypothetical protein